MSVPRPFTSMLPPSSTTRRGSPSTAHFRLPRRNAQAVGDLGGDGRVELPVVVLGPGVEAPCGRRDRRKLVALRESRRTKMGPESRVQTRLVGMRRKRTLPARLSRSWAAFPAARARAPATARALASAASSSTRMLTRSTRARWRTISAYIQGIGLELARPIGAVMRPRDPRCLVRLPLGRHAIAERGGRLREIDGDFA